MYKLLVNHIAEVSFPDQIKQWSGDETNVPMCGMHFGHTSPSLHVHVHTCNTHAHMYMYQHLLDIADCVWLARPLVNFSCQKLAYLYDLDQKLGKFQPTLPTPGSAAKIDTDPHPETKETAVSEEDKDSVFNNPASSKPIKPEPQDKPDAKTPTISPSPASKEENKAASKPSSAAISKEKSPVAADSQREDERVSYFHWCQHHSSLMLQLSCILQTIAIRCPTALVSMRSIGRGASGNKGAPPLTISPVGLTELPLPATIRQELQKKVRRIHVHVHVLYTLCEMHVHVHVYMYVSVNLS